MIKILIVDDHPLIRRGLNKVIDGEPDMQVAGEASTAAEALDLLHQNQWDFLILDISMPGRSGMEIVQEIHEKSPSLPILILSMHPERFFALPAFRAGASGYLTKEQAPQELIVAIRKILAGGIYVSSALAEHLAEELAVTNKHTLHGNLSRREHEVFHFLAQGKTVSEIAAQLSLSVKTISTYRARILEKLHLRNNAEIMRYAVQHRLVE